MSVQRSRVGAANLSIPLMLLTFLLVGGFMWWLNMNAEPTSVAATDERDDPAVVTTGGGGGVAVTEEDLRMTPERFENQVVRVTLPVAMAVGTQAFFLDVTDSPFLVKIGDALLQAGQTVPQGEVTVVGPLRPMTDQIRQDWISRGVVSADDEILVEFATHFIEAQSIEAGGAAATP